MTSVSHIMSSEEFSALGQSAVARGLYRNDPTVFLPGMAWYESWYWDYDGSWRAAGHHCMFDQREPEGVRGFLSPHYWRDWADKRPPICVICPNGEEWEIDRWSSNGDGWSVTGWPGLLTCSPSIVVSGYHGFLRNGEFTPDLDGRGPNGLTR